MPYVEDRNQVLQNLPTALRDLIIDAPEVEFATLTRGGAPISNPLFHYIGADGSTID